MNVDPHGLESKLVNDFFPIHGILILNKICEEAIHPEDSNWDGWGGKTPEEKMDEIWGKTIIYSAYTKTLDDRQVEFPKFDNLVRCISKEKETSVSDLMDAVTDFIKRKR